MDKKSTCDQDPVFGGGDYDEEFNSYEHTTGYYSEQYNRCKQSTGDYSDNSRHREYIRAESKRP